MPAQIYLLSGYLGSGKTTFLQKLLAHLRGQGGNVVVLMNEMGEEDIDGEQIQGLGFPVKKMLDGCICCSIRGELAESLKEIMTAFAPDQIIIETTGVADPLDLIDALTHPELYEHTELKGIVSVVDASRFLDLTSRLHSNSALVKTVRNQVMAADLIVLNKCDLVESHTLAKVRQKLSEYNSDAPVCETVHGEADIQAVLTLKRLAFRSVGQPAERQQETNRRPSVQKSIGRFSPLDKLKQSLGMSTPRQTSLYHSIETFSYRFKGPVDAKKFETFLRGLPKNVYRAKGYVEFVGQNNLISFQQTENQVLLFPFENFGPKMVAVFIGEGLDQQSIVADLEACYPQEKAPV
ncbi:CobW family GTP-binding protein [Brevibacillus sp. B_LB10_24]|jgi:G3E family GTPase|uniref:CobW family GTP-binding protein n=1 Tax=Brevibacillus TaxID=55080 RepID=UPI000300549C|nr:GTP-binding protein [Brevibacillus massiliensis]